MKMAHTPLALAMAALLATPAFAVYNQTVGITGDNGQPLDGATLTLEIPGTDPVTVTDNSEDDQDDRIGFIALPLDDDSRGQTATLTVTKDGQQQRRDIVLGNPVTVSLGGSAMSSRGDKGFELSIDLGTTDADIDANALTSWGAFKGDIDGNQPVFGINGRFHGNGFFVGGSANILDGDDKGLRLDLHPGNGQDTNLTIDREWFVFLYGGLPVFQSGDFAINLVGGVRIERVSLEAVTNESGGGGFFNRFENAETQYQPSVGVEFAGQFSDDCASGWRVALMVDQIDGINVQGASAGFGFPYTFSTDDSYGLRATFSSTFDF